jgi:mycothiol synthase
MNAVEFRGLVPDDHEPIRELWHSVHEAGLLTGFNASDIDLLVNRFAVHPQGVFVAAVDGAPVGFLHADAHLVVVREDSRRLGIGRRLVDYAESRLQSDSGERLLLWLPSGNEAAAHFYTALGLRYQASLWQLQLAPTHAVPDLQFPTDIALKSVEEIDLDEYVTLFNTAFAGHPTPLRITRPIVDWARTLPGYDPTMTLVLADRSSGQLIGLCRTSHNHDTDSAGEVKFIGLLPEWRGKGLGKALLAWGVNHLRHTGASQVSLNVEGENDGALALYENVGFIRIHEWRRFGR